MAKQNVPKKQLRGPYSDLWIHFAASTGEAASICFAAVGNRDAACEVIHDSPIKVRRLTFVGRGTIRSATCASIP